MHSTETYVCTIDVIAKEPNLIEQNWIEYPSRLIVRVRHSCNARKCEIKLWLWLL
jgi:hypothetical protein